MTRINTKDPELEELLIADLIDRTAFIINSQYSALYVVDISKSFYTI